MKLRKPDKVITVYWTKRELEKIQSDINLAQKLDGNLDYSRQTILEKCEKGIEAIEAYELGDKKMDELKEIMVAQNQTETMA